MLALLCLAAGAHAQTVKPWLPSGTDSLTALSAEARARFQTNKGDSATGTNYEAFRITSDLARLLIARLGREHTLQAPAVESVMDSLGLDTDVRVDPLQPSVLFVWVRNPYQPLVDGVGYLYWYRGNELRLQGAVFPPGRNPRMRSWWLGTRETPYETAVLFDRKAPTLEIGLRLFRMGPNGAFWNLAQYERETSLGEPGDAVFADPNGDGRPEVVAWTRAEADSFVTFGPDVPHLVNESVWTERPEGYRLHDVRVLPSPVSALALFLRQLAMGNRDGAARLLVQPARVTEALANGWNLRRQRGAWLVEYGESGDAWPEWLAVKERAPQGDRRWIFRFVLKDGRWMIQEWTAVKPATLPGSGTIAPVAPRKPVKPGAPGAGKPR